MSVCVCVNRPWAYSEFQSETLNERVLSVSIHPTTNSLVDSTILANKQAVVTLFVCLVASPPEVIRRAASNIIPCLPEWLTYNGLSGLQLQPVGPTSHLTSASPLTLLPYSPQHRHQHPQHSSRRSPLHQLQPPLCQCSVIKRVAFSYFWTLNSCPTYKLKAALIGWRQLIDRLIDWLINKVNIKNAFRFSGQFLVERQSAYIRRVFLRCLLSSSLMWSKQITRAASNFSSRFYFSVSMGHRKIREGALLGIHWQRKRKLLSVCSLECHVRLRHVSSEVGWWGLIIIWSHH